MLTIKALLLKLLRRVNYIKALLNKPIISVSYATGRGAWKYSNTITTGNIIPSGYQLLGTGPYDWYVSGDENAYLTDHSSSQSGQKISSSVYVKNNANAQVIIVLRWYLIRSELVSEPWTD